MTDLTAITVPKWGLAMEEGQVGAWLVAEGASVSAGDELVEVESSKIANVVEAPVAGTLLRQVVQAGVVLPVGGLLGVIGPANADAAAVDAFVAERQAAVAEELAAAAPAGPLAVDTPMGSIMVDEAGSGDGLPLVLIHGFTGDKGNWLFNTGAWAQGRRVIALDLPGHGGSVKAVGDGGIAPLADAVLAVIAALGLGRVVLVGHSLGAGVALAVAAKAPEQVAGLVLLAGFGLGSPVSPDFIEAMLVADRRKEMRVALAPLFADEDLVSGDMVEQALASRRIDGVVEALAAIAENALSPANGAALAALPVRHRRLVLHGAEDRVIAPPPGATMLPGVGHMPHMEAAAEVNAAVLGFVEGLT